MNRLDELIGREAELHEVGGALRRVAVASGLPVVGGYQVACSDEAEWECLEAFQRVFAEGLLPALKTNLCAPMRTVNLGGRYEQGAVLFAESHFALAQPAGSTKLLAVKINSHVATRRGARGPEYGAHRRYGGETPCCGTLASMLQGGGPPAARELAETFAAGDRDRLAVLRDPKAVPPEEQSLRAALASARLQAWRVAADIRRRRPVAPTALLVLACTTINRPDPDTEVVVGVAMIDWTGDEPKVQYRGLGDDPAAYRIEGHLGRLVVQDPAWPGE